MFEKTNFFINLNTIDKVKNFVRKASKCDYDIILGNGSYVIDGKSIMGIFSLNLSKDIPVHINEVNTKNFKNNFSEYLI